jgi:hypothetical protein
MIENKLKKLMTFKKNRNVQSPIFVSLINDSYIVAAYQGIISKYDILIKYRQKVRNSWSRIRTPKHIHWAVDVLIKMHAEREKTKKFLGKLIEIWEKTSPIRSEDDRKRLLSIETLLHKCKNDFKDLESLNGQGEYSLNFLILLAKLLMLQEKTNLETAYMFKNLLKALEDGEDIFKIVSLATHR